MEAFGVPYNPAAEPSDYRSARYDLVRAFEDDLLVARLIDREYHSFFGGVLEPTCGVAGKLRSPPNTADKAYYATL